MATEFGTGKTIFILAIVVGCFAILWPKIFYPMLQSSVSVKPNIVPSADCCDVIFEKDLNAIKIMTQLCEKILSSQSDFDKRLLLSFQHGKLTKEIVNRCNAEVHNKCDVDIREFLMEKVRLGRTYQQMLSELRSLNSSFCMKINFGISPGLIGAPRRMRVWEAKTLRQERPSHLKPDMMHPALREKGRAIPHSHIVPRVLEKEAPSSPLPMPMRPPMGGAGHVVPAPKGSSTMGIIMPLYTIGIVIFFMYTMMKLLFKKTDENNAYEEFEPDPEFRRVVFSDTERTGLRQKTYKEPHQEESTTKLGWKERDTRDIELDQLRRRLEETEAAMERIVAQMSSVPHKHLPNLEQEEPVKQINETKLEEEIVQQVDDKLEDKSELEEKVVKKFDLGILETNIELENVDAKIKEADKIEQETVLEEKNEGKPTGGAVQVVGMEMTESVEGGQKWSRPATPLTPRSVTPNIPPTPPPQSIYLEGSLPSQSQLLVSQSEIEKLSQESDESPVILAGKVTLSLIGVEDTLKSDNGGPIITSISSDEASEEEEEEIEIEEEEIEGEEGQIELEEEEVVEQAVSEDEAEPADNGDINGEEDLTTNYITASAAGGLGDETAGDFSVMEAHHDEEKEENEEELDEDIILSAVPVMVDKLREEKEEKLEEEIKEEAHEKDVILVSAPPKVPIQVANLQDEDEEEEIEEEVEEDEEEEEGEEEDVEVNNVVKPLAPIKAPEIKPVEVEEEEEEVNNVVEEPSAPIKAPEIKPAEVEEEEEEVEEDEEVEDDEVEEEEEEDVGRPQSLQHQHQR